MFLLHVQLMNYLCSLQRLPQETEEREVIVLDTEETAEPKDENEENEENDETEENEGALDLSIRSIQNEQKPEAQKLGLEKPGPAARVARVKNSHGRLQCVHCNKTYKSPMVLARHEFCHTNTRMFTCTICLKAFKLKHHLAEHFRLHTGEKPHTCSTCGKQFSHSGTYSHHRRVKCGQK